MCRFGECFAEELSIEKPNIITPRIEKPPPTSESREGISFSITHAIKIAKTGD